MPGHTLRRRFEAVPQTGTPDSYWIRDNDATIYHLPEKAVCLYMRPAAALKVEDALNEEWKEFLRNPS